MKTKKIIYLILFIMITSVSCSKLEETYKGSTSDVYGLTIEEIVAPAYSSLFHLWDQGETVDAARYSSQGGLFPIQEISTDEVMIPTRGTDWYDGGKWQSDYLLNWTANHDHIKQLYIELSQGISRANGSLLSLDKLSQTAIVKTYKAELYFLRSYYSYLMMDIYGQVPFREYNELDFLKDPKILDRKAAFDWIVNEVKNIALPGMADYGSIPYGRPTKDAAQMLLAKLYLNQSVYTGEPGGYDSCLVYVNKIINSGHYTIADDYWEIFSPINNINNGNKEIIFAGVQKETNSPDILGNYGMWNRPFMLAFHYKHKWSEGVPAPGGYNINGAVAPEEYCRMICAHTDTAVDIRWRDDRYIKNKANFVYLGFNYGQAYNMSARKQPVKVKARDGITYVDYTFECPLDGANEGNGVRVLKFYPNYPDLASDQTSFGISYANDYPIFRIADAYLMRAECNVRLGTTSGAAPVDDVNAIRSKRAKSGSGAGTLNVTADKVNLDFILKERAIELYHEMHRRQDLIRFGKFLGPKSNKNYNSDTTRILCPIPQTQIDIIKGLHQNPGY